MKGTGCIGDLQKRESGRGEDYNSDCSQADKRRRMAASKIKAAGCNYTKARKKSVIAWFRRQQAYHAKHRTGYLNLMTNELYGVNTPKSITSQGLNTTGHF